MVCQTLSFLKLRNYLKSNYFAEINLEIVQKFQKNFLISHFARTSSTRTRKYSVCNDGIVAFFVAMETMTSLDQANKNDVIISECQWMTFHHKLEQYRGGWKLKGDSNDADCLNRVFVFA